MTVPVLLAPGHPTLAPVPAPNRDLKRVLLYDGETPREVGTAAEELALDAAGGRPVLRRIQLLRFEPLGELAGIVTAEPRNLEPISHDTRHADLRIEAAYGELEITGAIVRRGGETTAIRTPRSALVFDLYELEILLRVLPLARDYAAEAELFWPERTAPVTVRLAVAGAESVASGGGRSELAWIVTAILADVETSYRIGVESRELLRQTQRLADGTRVDFAR